MSTSVESSKSKQYVEFDEFIDYKLEKTRNSIKWTDILTTLAGICALGLGYLLVFTLLDHWVVAGGFSATTRMVLLGLLFVTGTGWIVWKVVLPWWKQIHLLYAAQMLEEHSPSLKSSLLNLVDLRRSKREVPAYIRSAMEKRSAKELSSFDIEHAVDRRSLLNYSYLLLTLVVLCCLYALFSPKPISFLRSLTFADIPVATQTEIVEVLPGSTIVPARSQQQIRAVIRGKQPEQVFFHYTTRDQTFVDERLEMSPDENDSSLYTLNFAGENGDGIGQSVEYYLTAGDATSETYQLAVRVAPAASIEQIEYRYPEYMELPPRSQFNAAIDAWEGTEVTLKANTGGIPVTSARLEFLSDGSGARPEEWPLTITDGTRLSATWKLAFRNDGTYARKYRIICESKEGHRDPNPAEYPLTIRPDLSPEIALLDPQGDISRPANATVPLVYKARDPDFQISFVTLRVQKEGQELQSYPLFEGRKKVVADRFRWELEPLGLQPGDVVTFFLEARDNKHPSGNRKTTQPLKLTIVGPVSREEAKQQQAQEEAEQEPVLKDAQQEAAEENNEPAPGEAEQQNKDNEEGENSEKSDKGEDDKPGDEKGAEGKKEKENGDKGDNPDGSEDENQKPDGDKQPKKDDPQGDGSEADDKPGEGKQPSDNPKPLSDDGKDDAEALEKIIENQDQKKPGKGERLSEDQSQKGEEGAGEMPPEKGENNTGGKGGTPTPEQKQDDEPANGEGKGENAKPTDDEGSSSEKSQTKDDLNNGKKSDEPDDSGKPADKKRPGDPDTKGTGTPDDDPDPNAPRTNDPDNIDRKPGTEPKTVPAKDPGTPDPKQSPSKEQTDQLNKPKGTGKPGEKRTDPGEANQPDGPDRPDPAPGRPNGQKSARPDTGEEGSSQETSDGNPAEKGEGNADPSGKPGDSEENPAGKEGGKPGDKKGEGKSEKGAEKGETGGGKPGEEKSNGAKSKGSSSAAEGEGGEGEPMPSDAPSQGTKPGAGGDGKTSQAAPGNGEGNVPTDAKGEGSGTGSKNQSNLDNAKQAADLVLKNLEDELKRGEVDPKLLEELGWTEEQMQAFAERMRRQLETESNQSSLEEELKQKQFEEMLKNMEFEPKTRTAKKGNLPERSSSSFGARRLTPPLEYREQFEAFTRELSKQKQK